MKTYILTVLIKDWDVFPSRKEFKVRANSFTMAAGICKGQAAVNGYKILEVLKYEVEPN